ncbi:hypothetical protein HF888_11135 [Bermanella marisrubri]|uniref:Lipoprotein n=1 Tax=Bermanella marisrubri TaxID=207949 RepID=Q1MXM4_9GAMM|nr:hypothetical protein [Bermanella marisrubri]EAT10731.1 hypothetical protein RED65_07464 [Oceanobacter sp. RED65] [Bermanella marisrubri]QIZ84737.1 hypothetical protein HF888_11135 [Bermanella marisrubri]
MKFPLLLVQIAAIIGLLSMGACSSMPGAKTGNDLSYLSLRDKRLSEKRVQVLSQTPQSSDVLGVVTTKRCQTSVFSEEPQEKTLLVDMKAEAYRLGANAISDVKVVKAGAVGDGCWNLYTATANMLVVQ